MAPTVHSGNNKSSKSNWWCFTGLFLHQVRLAVQDPTVLIKGWTVVVQQIFINLWSVRINILGTEELECPASFKWEHFGFPVKCNDEGKRLVDKTVTVCRHCGTRSSHQAWPLIWSSISLVFHWQECKRTLLNNRLSPQHLSCLFFFFLLLLLLLIQKMIGPTPTEQEHRTGSVYLFSVFKDSCMI